MPALGETGSGKRASVVLPPVMALARAPRERPGGALAIDVESEQRADFAPVRR